MGNSQGQQKIACDKLTNFVDTGWKEQTQDRSRGNMYNAVYIFCTLNHDETANTGPHGPVKLSNKEFSAGLQNHVFSTMTQINHYCYHYREIADRSFCHAVNRENSDVMGALQEISSAIKA